MLSFNSYCLYHGIFFVLEKTCKQIWKNYKHRARRSERKHQQTTDEERDSDSACESEADTSVTSNESSTKSRSGSPQPERNQNRNEQNYASWLHDSVYGFMIGLGSVIRNLPVQLQNMAKQKCSAAVLEIESFANNNVPENVIIYAPEITGQSEVSVQTEANALNPSQTKTDAIRRGTEVDANSLKNMSMFCEEVDCESHEALTNASDPYLNCI